MLVNLPDKRYYSIGEIAKAFNVNTSLLRFWEKEFKEMTVGYGIGMFGYNMICLLIGLLIAYYIINNYDG